MKLVTDIGIFVIYLNYLYWFFLMAPEPKDTNMLVLISIIVLITDKIPKNNK